MKMRVKVCLKIAWLAAALAILLTGTHMCVSTDAACYQASETMFYSMFWLSFPTSLIFSLGALIYLYHGAVNYPSDFITAWMVLAFGGFVQWFIIVPRLFEKQNFTILNLEKNPPAADLQEIATELSPEPVKPSLLSNEIVVEPQAPLPAKALPAVSKPSKTRRKIIKAVAAFDRRGRTPLERVIDHL